MSKYDTIFLYALDVGVMLLVIFMLLSRDRWFSSAVRYAILGFVGVVGSRYLVFFSHTLIQNWSYMYRIKDKFRDGCIKNLP